MVTTAKFTRADYMALPEGYPAELLDGLLVKSASPTWGHQRLVMEILFSLRTLVGPGRAVPAPIDVFVDEHNVLQPDILVTPAPLSDESETAGIPQLVVEVLSPSTADRDRGDKPGLYTAAGVEEVWLVDPAAVLVEVHTRRGRTIFEGSSVAQSAAVPGFELVPNRLP